MQHEVYVPFAVMPVRSALADPERVARCVPGLQLEAVEADGVVTGRLKLRIGGSSITYRGHLSVSARGDGLVVEGRGEEVRGSGGAEFALTLTARPAQDGVGTTLLVSGSARGTGRLAEYEEKHRTVAGRKLLDRFAEAFADSVAAGAATTAEETETAPAAPAAAESATASEETTASEDVVADAERLVTEAEEAVTADPDGLALDPDGLSAEPEALAGEPGGLPGEPDGLPPTESEEPPRPAGIGGPEDNERVIPGIPAPDSAEPDTSEPLAEREPQEPGERPGGDPMGDRLEDAVGLFETEVPPSALDPLQEEGPEDATAEAAHARRTMIGRSAEEVDHAPPRGRYAPEPAPEESSQAAVALRWAAPLAAAALASAVIISRALRRRR